ncbi:MAG TPA: hypothetical protein VJT31_03530 [Rugosimonospora sp.]|nr:hypothetical protein [Rugosimonospora sp.]
MGIFRKREPRRAAVHNKPLQCVVCGGGEFWDREVKLNSTAMEFFDLGWANQSAIGVICARCGFVHQFLGDAIGFYAND